MHLIHEITLITDPILCQDDLMETPVIFGVDCFIAYAIF